MMKILFLFVSVFSTTAAICQTVQTKYYKNEELKKETTAEKASYSLTTTTQNDSTTTIELKNLKTNEVTLRECYRKNEPVGKWIISSGKETLDYDFELSYHPPKTADSTENKIKNNPFLDNDSIGYKAPATSPEWKSIYHFLASNINYPSNAKEEGIAGKVYLRFTITKTGKIADLFIMRGVDPSIDKEAMRAIKQLHFSSPALLNGQPENIYVVLPITFRLM